MSRKQLLALSLITAFSLLGSFLFAHYFPINTDILSSLGRNYFDREASLAYKLYEKKLERQVVIAFEGKELEPLHEKVKEIVSELDLSDTFEGFGTRKEAYKKIGKFYFDHRDLFLTLEQKELIRNDKIEVLREKATQKMYLPFFSSSYKLAADPLLVSDDFMENKASPVKLIPYGDFSIVEREVPTMIVSGTIKAGLEERALRLLKNVEKKQSAIKVYFSSLSFYAIYAKEQARFESTFFSMLSVLIILVIFWIYFKSFRHLAIATSAISICCLFGFVTTTLVFGEIYLMTLLLGISILGIMADYFIHFFVKERSIEKGKTAFKVIQRPLSWSLITSVSGFLLFLLAPLPILKQFGFFSAITLCFAFIFVRFVMPSFYRFEKKTLTQTPPNERLFNYIPKKILLVTILISTAFSLFCLLGKKKQISNDVRSFSTSSTSLKQHENKIKRFLGFDFSLKFILVKGEDAQSLIENEVTLKKNFSEYLSMISFSDWVPTMASQLESQLLYKKLPGYSELKSEPLIPASAIDQFRGADFTNLWIGKIGENFYSVVPLLGNSAKLKESIGELDYAFFLDKVGFINSDIEKFQRWLILGGGAFILVLFVVLAVKTGIGSSAKIIGIPFFSIVSSLCLSSLIFGSLNLFNFLGCVLIFGLGIDYAFFYYLNRRGNRLTAKAIEVSTLTTIASFGIMSFSSTFAVKSFGITVLFGIILTWLFIPFSAKELSDG